MISELIRRFKTPIPRDSELLVNEGSSGLLLSRNVAVFCGIYVTVHSYNTCEL